MKKNWISRDQVNNNYFPQKGFCKDSQEIAYNILKKYDYRNFSKDFRDKILIYT